MRHGVRQAGSDPPQVCFLIDSDAMNTLRDTGKLAAVLSYRPSKEPLFLLAPGLCAPNPHLLERPHQPQKTIRDSHVIIKKT